MIHITQNPIENTHSLIDTQYHKTKFIFSFGLMKVKLGNGKSKEAAFAID